VPRRVSRFADSEEPAPELEISELGRLIREKRSDQDLSIRKAAEAAHVSFSTLSRVEAGAQPDLSTFTSLCAWLGEDPARFFTPTATKVQSPLDAAIEHLVTDPALSDEAATRIANLVKDMYQMLTSSNTATKKDAPLAVHLRAANIMRPGVPERLASLLRDMRAELEHQIAR
jgi:transcriptional regulator with XRE-family HTH domain